jgi:hypothetical protein
MGWRRVVECVGLIDGFWQGWPSDLPIAMTGAGREGGSFRKLYFFWEWPVSAMYVIYTVLKKVSENCYPPSLHRAGP